ncbi:MAG: hypothetical protein MUF45_00950 [Spirosomaceae bacterium]|jgi:hypothetical protein|nr:hypothetical protein [Spirosomataceae bacterium]
MGKKNFNQGLNSLLGSPRESISEPGHIAKDTITQVLIQKSEQRAKGNTVKAGLKEGETRATLILNESVIDKLKAIAYWDRITLKTVVDDALQSFIDNYEKNNGKIKRVGR